MPDKAVIDYLQNKYNQEFEIVSSEYISETGNYDIRLSPKENPDLVFKVDHNPKKDHFNDYYPYAIWQFQADEYIRSFLMGLEVPFALRTGFSSNAEVDPTSIISFESLMKEHADQSSFNIFLHLFGHMNEETLSALVQLDALLRPKNLKKVGITTRVYHPISIQDQDMESLNFDFGVSTEESFEQSNADHFLGLIKYRIDTKNPDSPTVNAYKEIVADNPNLMMFKKL